MRFIRFPLLRLKSFDDFRINDHSFMCISYGSILKNKVPSDHEVPSK